jgi:hypothetical protein
MGELLDQGIVLRGQGVGVRCWVGENAGEA